MNVDKIIGCKGRSPNGVEPAFAAYAKVQDARSSASVIGEELDNDKAYLKFGTLFEKHFIDQGFDVNRSIDETLDLGCWWTFSPHSVQWSL